MTIIHFKKKYIYINNKKTNSTWIYDILKEDSPEIWVRGYINQKPIGKNDNYIQIKTFLDSKKIDINQFYIFGFVLNPITRIACCYHYENTQKMSNVKDLNLNSKDFNLYIKKDLNLHFDGIDTVFYNHERKKPFNVHIFEIERVTQLWEQIEYKLGLNNVMIPYLNQTHQPPFYLEPTAAIVIRDKYPVDWDFYFNR